MMLPTGMLLLGLALSTAQPKGLTTETKGDKFSIDVSETTMSVKPGENGKFVLQIKAAEGYKVSDEAPLKIKIASDGVSLSKNKLGSKDAKPRKFTSPTFKVPFTAKDAVQTSIDVNASFFVCDVKICERRTAKLAIPISVKP